MFQLPSRYWTQYSYCGFGQPLALAVKATIEPAGWVALAGDRLTLAHGGGAVAVSVDVGGPAGLPLLRATACGLGQGVVPAARGGVAGGGMFQVLSRYGTQYSYWGLGQPLALAVKPTADPAGCVALAGDRLTLAHGGGAVTVSVAVAVCVRLPLVPVMVSE